MSDSPKKYEKKPQSFLALAWRPAIVLVGFAAFAVYAFVTPRVPAMILFTGWAVLIPVTAFQVYILLRLFSIWQTGQLLEKIGEKRPDAEAATERFLSQAKQKPENHSQLADALYARSLFFYTRGNFALSLNAAHERVELLRDCHDTSRLAPALVWLAEVCGRTGQMESAQRHITLALNLLQPTSMDSASATTSYAGALRCQGSLLYQLHKFEAAVTNFTEALSLMKSIEAPEQVLMPFMTVLGATLTRLNQLESADKMLGEALRVAEKYEQKDSKLLASVYTRAGRMYTQMGNLELAETYCARAISILEAIPEGERGADGAYYANAGLLLFKQGRLPESEAVLKKAIQQVKENCGRQHPNLVDIQETLHAVLAAQNRLDEAAEIAREKDAIIKLYEMG